MALKKDQFCVNQKLTKSLIAIREYYFYQPPALEWQLIMYSVISVCLCAINFCKHCLKN